ncbi:MAG TPA: sulfite exporter TauE/SafE family protein [Xanthobacteraceae bacterium]|nr:sulfite exporter TauE/SafE family protein [Xanthobacteraceae bacterium]
MSLSDLPAVFSGSLVGLILGVIGGGGSILAVPLLVYVVGVKSPHVAIGTSAIAVALSAFVNLIDHARRHHVCWSVAMLFAIFGVAGAAVGSTLGKHTDGQKLLMLFGILMIAVAASMALRSEGGSKPQVQLDRRNAPWVAGIGFAVGALSGFFGIGGGFLVVPGLVAATSMTMIVAIGSSLVSVTAFGLTTAANYALSDLIDWRLVLLFVGGGVVGGLLGGQLATTLAEKKRALSIVFAVVVATVGVYVVVRGMMNLMG